MFTIYRAYTKYGWENIHEEALEAFKKAAPEHINLHPYAIVTDETAATVTTLKAYVINNNRLERLHGEITTHNVIKYL